MTYKLLEGDALLQIQFVKPESIDTVFTSPEPPINHYEMQQLIDIMLQLPRVLKQTGSIWINMSDYHNANNELAIIPERFLYEMVTLHEWHLINTIIWDRRATFDAGNPARRFRRTHEYLYWFVKDITRYYFPEHYVILPDVIRIAYERPRQDVFESGFPIELIEQTAIFTTPINGRILDPFCGTGTTGVVALQHRREFLGIESNTLLIPKIKERLNQWTITETNLNTTTTTNNPNNMTIK